MCLKIVAGQNALLHAAFVVQLSHTLFLSHFYYLIPRVLLRSNAEALMDLSGYTKECGEYSITYSLATPWIQGRAAATVTRKVGD
jgi:hypothetical protein